ncbi:hypothetical protein GV64_07790 [Endozoicomonas elysicola]|uniref:Uncharacterized protein n=2 Tax=Endozoicomonas elysicola TaxID=305900 RepID=A0A081K929_9GAMM|nr:hypothetical protein GV64_07790 [Endozoicomonas elysicola]
MNVQPSTEAYLTPQQPSELHSFLVKKANESRAASWVDKKNRILEINSWHSLSAEWDIDPKKLLIEICHAKDIKGVSNHSRYQLLRQETELVNKMVSNTASRNQHTPYQRPERYKESESPKQQFPHQHSSSRLGRATATTQNVTSSTAQLYCCNFLENQAEIGLSVIWADRNQGILKVINSSQLKSEWYSFQQRYGVANGETLQGALKKESEKGDIIFLKNPDSQDEPVFQLKHRNYPASTIAVANNCQRTLPTEKSTTSHTSTSTLQDAAVAIEDISPGTLKNIIDIWKKAEGELPDSPIKELPPPVYSHSTSKVEPTTSVFNTPKTCEGCLSFIFSDADSHQRFAKWHNRSNGELTINIDKLTHHWLSLHSPGYTHQTGFDFVARFFATQNYWTYDTGRNVYCLNGQHPVTRQALIMTNMKGSRLSSTTQLPDFPNPSVQHMPHCTSEVGDGNQPLIFPSQSFSEPPKNSMLEWIMQDIYGYRKFTQWHEILRNELKLDLNALQIYWNTNLQFFGLENIHPRTAYNSINELVNLGLCQYNHQTGILTLNDYNPPQVKTHFQPTALFMKLNNSQL